MNHEKTKAKSEQDSLDRVYSVSTSSWIHLLIVPINMYWQTAFIVTATTINRVHGPNLMYVPMPGSVLRIRVRVRVNWLTASE